jgi:hypothetical protein
MTTPSQFDNLLEEMEKATDEIRRLKDVQRIQLLRSPETDMENLMSAISYWEQRKCEAEDQIRLLR